MRHLKGFVLGSITTVMLMGANEDHKDREGRSFFWAMVQKESSHSPNPPAGDEGKAVGPLQIWPITVKDVNRIGKLRGWPITYTLEDRNDLWMSLDMFYLYQSHYAAYYKDWSAEGMAKRWNGGPNGHTQASTEEYWGEVEDLLTK